jgi:hypothetical protein
MVVGKVRPSITREQKKKRVSKEEELRDELNKLRIKLSNKKS